METSGFSFCYSAEIAINICIAKLILFRQRLDDFLGVLGGNLGLYIGASLISILEILLFLVTGLFKIVTHMFR
jgi:hypothetical protein